MGVQHGQLFTGSCLVPPMQTPKSPKWAICLLESLVLIWCARTSLSLLPGTTGPTSTIQCQCFRTHLIKFVKNILNNWEKCTSWFFSISCKSLQNIHHLVSPSPIISPPQSRNPNRRRLGFLPQEGPNQEPSQQGWKNEGPPGAPSSNRDRPLRWKDTASKKEQKCTKKTMKKETTCKFEIPMSKCPTASRGFWSLSMSLGKIRQRAACSITWRCDSSESRPSATSKCLRIQQVKEITNDHYQNRKSLLLDSWTWHVRWLTPINNPDVLDSNASSSAPLPSSW